MASWFTKAMLTWGKVFARSVVRSATFTDVAVLVLGSNAVLESIRVSDIQPQPGTLRMGHGMAVQRSEVTGFRGAMTVRWSQVERERGVYAFSRADPLIAATLACLMTGCVAGILL